MSLIIKLDKLLAEGQKQIIIDWFEILKIYNTSYGKIPHLFGNDKIQIETVSETGAYNVILVWLKNNIEHFRPDDFINIPDSNHTKISDLILSYRNLYNLGSPKVQNTFITKEDVARWKENPTIHPIKGIEMNPVVKIYYAFYIKAYKILSKSNIRNEDIPDLLPKNHILFGNIDLYFYYQSGNSYNNTKIICEILTENNDLTEDKYTILEKEIALLENLFNPTEKKDSFNNLENIREAYEYNIENVVSKLFKINFNLMTSSLDDIVKCDIMYFNNFMENNKLDNGMIIIDYIKQLDNTIEWRNECLKLYNSYKNLYDDIVELFDKNSGIIENYENIVYTKISDPIDEYFKPYEEELKPLTDQQFCKFIDMTTFKRSNIEEKLKYKRNNTSMYLNDKDFAKYEIDREKAKEEYEKNKKDYNDLYNKYENDKKTDRTLNSPKFPIKPIILLGNGTQYTYGNQEPTHINDKILESFNITYNSLKPKIAEYNKLKNMSYMKLIKYLTNKSPVKTKINELLQMTRQEIKDKVLYRDDESPFKDYCSEKIDILTNDEFDDENYPLSKLQLIVKLKMNKKTECLYAPNLYNYLVDCVNSKKPFINPITKQIYTKEHIDQLMYIMHIIDPGIKKPKYLKPINDTKLKLVIEEKQPFNIEKIKRYSTFTGWDDISEIEYYQIKIMRQFGDKNYSIFNLCSIPSNIESNGIFATESTDLTSSVMVIKIKELFDNGRLLCKYIPPYYGTNSQYIDLGIHFNRYRNIENWINIKNTKKYLSKTEFIDLFKHYAEEINNFI